MEADTADTTTTLTEDIPHCGDGARTDDAVPVTSDAIQDHPNGDEIRRQVEYYFSDENLPTDTHLLQCCGGRENLPISINRICGFRKMRQFKPKSLVTAALRRSTFLEVSADGKTIKRKVPLQGKCILDPDFFDDEDIAYDPRVQKPVQHSASLILHVKVPKDVTKPTGFERTYVEPLLTSGEAAQEDEMYALDRHFVERIEIAIQRFKQKRRMQSMYALVFEKLMRFGGVESGPRMYQGLSKQDMKDMDAEELARALATHHVSWDRSDESQWAVDFVGVCKGFLSSWYPTHYGHAPHIVKNACQVLRSFFRYLRYHGVCPEYEDQLSGALQICDAAEEQLPKVHSVGLALPGDFNKSASIKFCGAQAGLYTGDKAWINELREEGMEIDEIGICEEEARVRFGLAMAILGSKEQFGLYSSSTMEVLEKKSSLLEVIIVHLPSDDTKYSFVEYNRPYQHKVDIKPLGRLICKAWYTDSCDEYDLPKDKYPTGKPDTANDGQQYEFWVEEDILKDCFVGMKMDADILVLSGGLTILDDIRGAMCSFYVWLPNELLMERKPKDMRWPKKSLDEGKDDKPNETVDNSLSDDEFDDD